MKTPPTQHDGREQGGAEPAKAGQAKAGQAKAEPSRAEAVKDNGPPIRDTPLQAAVSTPPIAFFDGNCGMCAGLVRLLDAAARGGRVRFEPLQGELALRHLEPRHFAQDTLWLKQGARLHARSSAVLRLMWLAGWPWKFLAVLLLVPRPLRDRVYDAIARRRR